MTRKTKKRRSRRGFTLVEIMCTITVLSVAVIGTSGYRYFATLDVQRADTRTTAARMALLLCEGWRGVNGSQTWDPTTYLGSDLVTKPISYSTTFNDLNVLQGRTIVSNDTNYHVFLLFKDVEPGLRALNVIVAWSPKGRAISSIYDITNPDNFELFELTTYATY